jgi:hypothetical protein
MDFVKQIILNVAFLPRISQRTRTGLNFVLSFNAKRKNERKVVAGSMGQGAGGKGKSTL